MKSHSNYPKSKKVVRSLLCLSSLAYRKRLRHSMNRAVSDELLIQNLVDEKHPSGPKGQAIFSIFRHG
jgi:hypothetical protein